MRGRQELVTKVLPACAGVILESTKPLSMAICFTRMRGGDPVALIAERSGIAFYPHARG